MPKKQINYDWLKISPTEEELSANEDGSVFIPIGIVEMKLYRLDSHWGTENFKFQLLVGRSGTMWAEGSLELIVTYARRTRRLVGTATLIVPADTDFDNPTVNSNFSATLKSESIKNAVKPIGLAFGQGLNDRLTINTPQLKTSQNGRKKPAAVEMPPDPRLQEKYNLAVENCNSTLMNSIKSVYTKIKYTGLKKLTDAES